MIGHPNLRMFAREQGALADLTGNIAAVDTGITYNAGVFGQKANFNGGTGSGQALSPLPLGNHGTANFTIAMRLAFSTNATQNFYYEHYEPNGGQSAIAWTCGTAPGGLIVFSIRDVTTANRLAGYFDDTPYRDGVERHHAFVREGPTTLKYYINGETKAFTTFNAGDPALASLSGTTAAYLGIVTIGGTPYNSLYGSEDEVQIYKHALHQSEIKRIMLGLPPFTRS